MHDRQKMHFLIQVQELFDSQPFAGFEVVETKWEDTPESGIKSDLMVKVMEADVPDDFIARSATVTIAFD